MLSHFSDIQLFCDPVDYSLPSFSVWDFPGKNTGLVAISFSRRSSPSKDQTWVSCLAGRLFTSELPGKPLPIHRKELKSLTWDVYFFVISSNLLMYMDFPAPPPPPAKTRFNDVQPKTTGNSGLTPPLPFRNSSSERCERLSVGLYSFQKVPDTT